jgi:hypothetical protein
MVHTFAYPEMDVVDIYRHMQDGSFELSAAGVWGIKG